MTDDQASLPAESASLRETASLLEGALGRGVDVRSTERIDGGRGVFSEVIRVEFADGLPSLVIKQARTDANGAAAIASGAYQREALAYERILPATPGVRHPAWFGSSRSGDGGISFVLEDLTELRAVNQIDGLDHADVIAIVAELVVLHERWNDGNELADLPVRRDTPSVLSPVGIAAGLAVLDSRWVDRVGPDQRRALHQLVSARERVVSAFVAEGGPTLCHGDPRADNVVFDADGRAVLFDWQQMAVQFGEADLAWLLATSVTPETRRSIEADVVASYALARGQDAATTWQRYRLGMTLPGLSVLFLAQREVDSGTTEQLIATSLGRIGSAVDELGVADLGSEG